MPQAMLPLFPAGTTNINALLGFKNEREQVVYFNGSMPVFTHSAADTASFKMITAQFCVTGTAKQVEISRAFGVTLISVKRAVKCYRTYGAAGFFSQQKRRGVAVLTTHVLRDAQQLLDKGLSGPEVAAQLALKPNTLSKAIKAGKLHSKKKNSARMN